MFTMRIFAALAATVLVACHGNSSPRPQSAAHRRAVYVAEAQSLLADVSQRSWYPDCGWQQLPAGARCGMVVSADWRAKLDAACGARDDVAECGAQWVGAMRGALESRYGGSVRGAQQACGANCSDPYFLELEMMKVYNQRIDAEYREELRALEPIQPEELRLQGNAEAEFTRARVAESYAASLREGQPQTCTSGSQCAESGVCMRAQGSLTRGVCARPW